MFGIFRRKKTKPFHENKSELEQLQWFSETPPWNAAPQNIISAVMDTYKGSPLLEVFVVASIENNLVPNYIRMGKEPGADFPEVIQSKIATLLSSSGIDAANQFFRRLEMQRNKPGSISKQKMLSPYMNAMNLLESSVHIGTDIPAFIQLIKLRLAFDKKEEARTLINMALLKLKEIDERNIEISKKTQMDSVLKSIESSRQAYSDMKEILLDMRHDLS